MLETFRKRKKQFQENPLPGNLDTICEEEELKTNQRNKEIKQNNL